MKKHSYGTKHSVNEIEKRELDLYAENTGELHNQKKSILANIKRKKKSGKLDSSKLPKLWMYWVDNASKQYSKEFPGTVFNKPTRMALANELAKRYANGEE